MANKDTEDGSQSTYPSVATSKGRKIKSNDEIVDDITKDLEKTVFDDNFKEQDPLVKSEDEESEDDEMSDVDDESLKEREISLSEEDKISRKDEAHRLKEEGNTQFKEKNFKEAATLYTTALKTCPLSYTNERSVMFSNRAACKVKLEKKDEAVMDCSKALELNPNYLKAVLRRAQLYREMEKLDESLVDYQRVLELDSNILEAREAVLRLPDEINERNEKLKTEMMGKLKELGNMVLKPFGLSTNNFNLVQDPNSGGYSINFQQNSNQ